tara:strand:+ start:11909 stop:13312 length:1404 start_codon:yes stop_codon:yes gene_type:complete
MLRKTKIIATLGPATDSPEMIGKLVKAGVNIFRLNMSHANHDWVRSVTGAIRAESEKHKLGVAILMDLQGPSIRTGDVDSPIQLNPGDVLEIRMEGAEAEMARSTTVNYPGLLGDVKEGETMLIDNGVIHVKVEERRSDRLICQALTEGEMGSRRHVNLPGIQVSLPAMTEKDQGDVALAAELGLDFIALSFVRDAESVNLLRRTMDEMGFHAKIVAKIEDQEAVRKIDGIILAADAVMVARGDLGIEVHAEELPIVQRNILRRCAELGRKVIVATHMLESMIENPVPTRAEVTDIANAVFEQADAIMLSGETSVGAYPVKCIEMFDRIAKRMEREPGANYCENAELKNEKQKSVMSAVALANSIEDSSIVVFTARGVMANYVAHQRPKKASIFAFTGDPSVCQALHLNRAVFPFQTNLERDARELIEDAVGMLRREGLIAEGSSVVILSDVLVGEFVIDSILLQKA